MATEDDTAKPARGRRNQHKCAAGTADIAAAASGAATPPDILGEQPPPPRTLEEAIERVRTQLIEGRAMLHCLADVLLYADDDDSVMHSDTAQVIKRWVNDAAEQLDPVKLQPLIDAIRHRGGGKSGGDEPQGAPASYPYQVREPTAVYHV